jgi:hypothetical protein
MFHNRSSRNIVWGKDDWYLVWEVPTGSVGGAENVEKADKGNTESMRFDASLWLLVIRELRGDLATAQQAFCLHSARPLQRANEEKLHFRAVQNGERKEILVCFLSISCFPIVRLNPWELGPPGF